MNPTRVSAGGSYRFDRRFRGVGRITRASGAQDVKLFNRLDAMLTELHEDGKIDVLRAIKEGRLTALEVYAAQRAGRVSHVASEVVLYRNLWEVVDDWLANADVSPATIDRYRVSFVVLKRQKVLGSKAMVRDLDSVDWKRRRKAWPNSPADWNRMRAAVGRMLTVLLDDVHHEFRRRVMRRIPRAVEPTGRVPDLTVPLFWKIVEAAGEQERAAFVSLAVTGLRADSEFCALREEHLMPHTHSINVPGTKTAGSAAVVRVGPIAWEWVVAAVPSFYAHSTLYKKFKKAAAAVGSPELTLHDLRHLSGQLMIDGGVPESVVQTHLRHKTPGMTRRYLIRKQKGEAGEVADRMLFGGEESA